MEQKVPIVIAPTTAGGKPAQVETASVELKEGNATFAPATDEEKAAAGPGLLGFIVSEDVPGTSKFSVKGDPNLDPNVTEVIEDEIVYEYVSAQAAVLNITAGVAVPK